MTDMTEMVKRRRDQIAHSIAKREAEIEMLRGEIAKLDQLHSLASELFPTKDPVVLTNPDMTAATTPPRPKIVKPRVQVAPQQSQTGTR